MGYVLPGHTMGGVVQQQLTAGKQNYTSKGSLMDDETLFVQCSPAHKLRTFGAVINVPW